MADRNARIGDNWRNRYDSMRFHVPTTLCTMPYLREHLPFHDHEPI